MEQPLMIAVCDDSRTDLAQTRAMTEHVLRAAGFDYRISEFESGRQLMEAIDSGTSFQILLLDVLLDDMSGLDLAAALRKQQNKTEIIFVSVNRELALRGYEVSAARYLAKPLDAQKLKEALLYCYRMQHENRDILLPSGLGQRRVSVADIRVVEAYERGTRFYLENETVDCKLKFKEAEELLGQSGFVSCHRSYLVNIAQVRNIRRYEFELTDGETVPIGKSRYAEVRKKFFAYVMN